MSTRIYVFLVSAAICLGTQVRAQTVHKEVKPSTQMWTQYSVLARVHEKWSVYADFVDRFNEVFQSQNTIFLRPALVYHLNSEVSLYAGYCYATSFPDDQVFINQPEQRPWQQLLMSQRFGKFSVQHRYRLEERFNRHYTATELQHGSTFTWRFRYKLSVQYPVLICPHSGKELSVLFSDEVHISFGSRVTVSYFNQNRLFLGVSWPLTKSVSVAAGWQQVFRSTGTPGLYENIQTFSLNINHKLDFRKKKTHS